MKLKIIPLTALAALVASSSLHAQTPAFSKPSGYETIKLQAGFNFAGVRLQNPTILAGQIDAITSTTITDNEVNFSDSLIDGRSYIIEFNNNSGIVQVTGVWSGNDITVAADLTGDVAIGDNYSIREVSTLSSVFGSSANGHKLNIGAGGSAGADEVWFWNGAGYDKYYFDEFAGASFDQESWVNLDTSLPVDGSKINLIYANSVVISAASARDVVITGQVKTGSTELNLVQGFNFVGSVAPAGATLGSVFGDTAAKVKAAGLGIGGGGAAGADEISIWNGAGFDKYYFDEFGGANFDQESWIKIGTGELVSPDTVLPSGYVISASAAGDVISNVPESYNDL